jgi:hypothetical protein
MARYTAQCDKQHHDRNPLRHGADVGTVIGRGVA